MQNDSILAFAIAYALQESPELLEAEIIKLMREKAQLEKENLELQRLVLKLQEDCFKYGGR
jgi:hypothetical protein